MTLFAVALPGASGANQNTTTVAAGVATPAVPASSGTRTAPAEPPVSAASAGSTMAPARRSRTPTGAQESGTSPPRTKHPDTGPVQGVTAFAEPILGRDLFNSIPDPKPQPEAPSSHEPRRSELEWKLIATSVASDARWSTAIVRPDERDGRSRIVALGDRVGGAEVLEILAPWLDAQGKHHPARIVVNNDGQLEFLQENNPEPKVRKERKKRKRRRRRRDRRKR